MRSVLNHINVEKTLTNASLALVLFGHVCKNCWRGHTTDGERNIPSFCL